MRTPVPITFCITELDPGGAERALWQVCKRLDRDKWSPDVVCLGPEAEVAKWLRSSDIPTTCLGMRGARDILRSRALVRHLRDRGSIILQTFLYHANLIGRFAGQRARTPIVVSGIRVAEKRSKFRLKVDGWTRKFATHHLCVSQSVRQFTAANSKIPISDMTVIPNGVEFDRFANAERPRSTDDAGQAEHLSLLYVGRLDEQKNPLLMLKALCELRRVGSTPRLRIVGHGPLEDSLRAFVGEQRLTDQVEFVGYSNQVECLMKAANALLLPSRWEGMPNVVLEAMASGLPVIATEVDGTRELARDGDLCRLFPSESLSGLMDSIRALETHREDCAALARKAQAHVKEHFTWESIASAYSDFYERRLSRIA